MTERRAIHPEQYRAAIAATLRTVGLSQCEVICVESVQDWAHAVGIDERNPFRSGMAVRREDGVFEIVLVDEITPDMQEGIIPAMEMRGFIDEVARLADSGAFLEHLVLHEAAHLLLGPGATNRHAIAGHSTDSQVRCASMPLEMPPNKPLLLPNAVAW